MEVDMTELVEHMRRYLVGFRRERQSGRDCWDHLPCVVSRCHAQRTPVLALDSMGVA